MRRGDGGLMFSALTFMEGNFSKCAFIPNKETDGAAYKR